jgi:predicted O-methyltransferase YrrM
MLTKRYESALANDRVWAVSYSLWHKLPYRVSKWLRYRVIGPAEDRARAVLRSHPELRRLRLDDLSDYALSHLSLLLLWQLLKAKRPAGIVEFGSGVSTSLFALYAKGCSSLGTPPPAVFSVEHDESWLTATRQRLRDEGLDSYVRLLHAPLIQLNILGRSRAVYDLGRCGFREVGSGPSFDFCLVDGPPGEFGRGGVLPCIAPWLTAGATIVLDDIWRLGEQSAWEDWGQNLSGSLNNPKVFFTDHGVAVASWMPARTRVGNSISPGP